MVQYAVPNSTDSLAASWTVVGASTAHEATDEGINSGSGPDNSTTRVVGIASLASAGEDAGRVGLETLNDPGTNNRTGHVLRFVMSARDTNSPLGSPGSIGVRLVQGASTVIASWYGPSSDTPSIGTYSTFTKNISEAQAQGITDYSDLHIEWRYTTQGTEEWINITAFELEVPDPYDFLAETSELEIDQPAVTPEIEVDAGTAELEIDLPPVSLLSDYGATATELEIDQPAITPEIEVDAGTAELEIDQPAVSIELEGVLDFELEIDQPAVTPEVEITLSVLDLEHEVLPASSEVEVSAQTQELEIDLPAVGLEIAVSLDLAVQDLNISSPPVSLEIESLLDSLDLEIDLPAVTVEDVGGGGDVDLQLAVNDIEIELAETSISIEFGLPLQALEIESLGAFELDIELAVLEAVIEILPAGVGSDVLLQLGLLELRMTVGEFRTVNGTTYHFQKERIHNKLVSVSQLGLFFPVAYSVSTDMMGIDGLDTAAVNPKSIETNETISRMGTAVRKRTDGRRDRLSWTWELFLDFQEEVALEIFEKELLLEPPVLPKDDSLGLQQVTLNLVDCGYSHPPEHESSSGTQAKLTFDAVLGPT